MANRIRYLGIAFIELITNDNKVVLFDPWVKSGGNPHCPIDIDDIENVDLILVSHDHNDHIGSTVPICKKTNALLGGPIETMWKLIEKGVQKNQIVNNGNGYLPGGGIDLKWIKVVSTPAHHTSDSSCALGHIVITQDGISLFHTGDTSLIAEMEIYARIYPLDIVILPIGGGGTMDAWQAAEAVKMMKPKYVMPIHFEWNSNPQKALNDFILFCNEKNPEVQILKPISGEYYEISKN